MSAGGSAKKHPAEEFSESLRRCEGWLHAPLLAGDVLEAFSVEDFITGHCFSGAVTVAKTLNGEGSSLIRRLTAGLAPDADAGAGADGREGAAAAGGDGCGEGFSGVSEGVVRARRQLSRMWEAMSRSGKVAAVERWLDALEYVDGSASNAAAAALQYVALGCPSGDSFSLDEARMLETGDVLMECHAEGPCLKYFLHRYQSTDFRTGGKRSLDMAMSLLYTVLCIGQGQPDFCDRFGGLVEQDELALLLKLLDAVMVCIVYTVLPVKKVVLLLRTSIRVVLGSLEALQATKPASAAPATTSEAADMGSDVRDDASGAVVVTRAASTLYRTIHATLFQRVVCFVAMLIACSPIKPYSGKLQLFHELGQDNIAIPEGAAKASRSRHKEIVAAAVSEIVLLLLKHWRRSHHMEFEYLSQLLSAATADLFTHHLNHDLLLFMAAADPLRGISLTDASLLEIGHDSPALGRAQPPLDDGPSPEEPEDAEAASLSPPPDAVMSPAKACNQVPDLAMWLHMGGRVALTHRSHTLGSAPQRSTDDFTLPVNTGPSLLEPSVADSPKRGRLRPRKAASADAARRGRAPLAGSDVEAVSKQLDLGSDMTSDADAAALPAAPEPPPPLLLGAPAAKTELGDDGGGSASIKLADPPAGQGAGRPKRPPPLKLDLAGMGLEISLTPSPEVDADAHNADWDNAASWLCRRRVQTVTYILRIMQKVTKGRPQRIKTDLVGLKTALLFKRSRALTSVPPVAYYSLKLLKSQVRGLGAAWRKSNMSTISAIYRHVRMKPSDKWLLPSNSRNTGKPDGAPKPMSEAKLRRCIKAYNKHLETSKAVLDSATTRGAGYGSDGASASSGDGDDTPTTPSRQQWLKSPRSEAKVRLDDAPREDKRRAPQQRAPRRINWPDTVPKSDRIALGVAPLVEPDLPVYEALQSVELTAEERAGYKEWLDLELPLDGQGSWAQLPM